MTTKLDLDDALIREAQELGCHKTKADAVNAALAEYVKRRRQLEILDLFGKVEYYDDYDPRAHRRR